MYSSLHHTRYHKVTLRSISLKMYKIGKIDYIIAVFHFPVLMPLNLYFRTKSMRPITEFPSSMSVWISYWCIGRKSIECRNSFACQWLLISTLYFFTSNQYINTFLSIKKWPYNSLQVFFHSTVRNTLYLKANTAKDITISNYIYNHKS